MALRWHIYTKPSAVGHVDCSEAVYVDTRRVGSAQISITQDTGAYVVEEAFQQGLY
jgi:hypothetical protein